MNSGKLIHRVLGLGTFIGLAGCASIISGRHVEVTFFSNVPDAHIIIRDQNGEEVVNTNTPGTVATKTEEEGHFSSEVLRHVCGARL